MSWHTSPTSSTPPYPAPDGQEWWFFRSRTGLEERINHGKVRWWLQDVGSPAKKGKRCERFAELVAA